MKLRILSSVFVFALCVQAHADCDSKNAVPGTYIVRLKKFSGASMQSAHQSFENFLASNQLHHNTVFDSAKLSVLSAEQSVSAPPTTYVVENVATDTLGMIKNHPAVDTVENDCLFEPYFSNNDPYMNQQWNLQTIQAENAWAISKGSSDIIIGISDTGVDYNHPDIHANMWVNTKEIPANQIDDDNNGCIDDIYGCDFADHTGDPMPNGSTLTHGTHVAGIAAAVGNNAVGISGVVQTARILAAKGFSSNGTGDSAALLKTIYYAVDSGARVINCSWGRLGSPAQADIDAFDYAYNKGVVVVVAAGNNNIDASGFSPASLSHVITVAATDSQDQIATFSNWGTTVEVAAPGGKGYDTSGNELDPILSTLPGNKYGGMMGTSMAAPHVTGLVAMILSINSGLSPTQVLKILQDGGDLIHVTTYQSGNHFDYKRINAFGSAKLALATLPPGTGPGGGACVPGDVNCSSSASSLGNTLTNGFSQSSGCGSISNVSSNINNTGNFSALFSALAFLLFPLFFALKLKT